jgi:hypothetical protein
MVAYNREATIGRAIEIVRGIADRIVRVRTTLPLHSPSYSFSPSTNKHKQTNEHEKHTDMKIHFIKITINLEVVQIVAFKRER